MNFRVRHSRRACAETVGRAPLSGGLCRSEGFGPRPARLFFKRAMEFRLSESARHRGDNKPKGFNLLRASAAVFAA